MKHCASTRWWMGLPSFLFRRDVGEIHPGADSLGYCRPTIFLLVDAGDELLSLHDLFLATGQVSS